MSGDGQGGGGGAAGARVQILLSAVLFSTGGAAIKSADFSGLQVAALRSAVAAVFIALVLPSARRGWRREIVPIAVAYAATMFFFVQANKLTTAANTIFLQSTAPFYVLVLSPWLLREPIQRRDVGFMAAMAAGMALFFLDSPPVQETAPRPLLGNLCALAAGLCWALLTMGLRWLQRRSAGGEALAPKAVALGNVITFLALAPLTLPWGGHEAGDWLVILYLGAFQVGLAYVFLMRGVGEVRAIEASLLLLLEPVLNPVWAWLVHGERPGAWALAGGAVILGSSVVNMAMRQRAAPPADRAAMAVEE